MKRFYKTILLSAGIISGIALTDVYAAPQQFRHVSNKAEMLTKKAIRDSIAKTDPAADTLVVRTPAEIIALTDVGHNIPSFNRLTAPWVFSQYRALDRKKRVKAPAAADITDEIWRLSEPADTVYPDTISVGGAVSEIWNNASGIDTFVPEQAPRPAQRQPLPPVMGNVRPAWLENAFMAWDMQEDLMYTMMVEKPSLIEYAYWELPVPPSLPDEDHGFQGFLKRTFVPDVKVDEAVIPDYEINKKHWLHVVNGALQFSQAYISDNWYQGGNNHLALLINFLWDVQLNPVYHPKLLFQSTLSYKLGLNSTEEDKYHKYSISQDIFQYNLKFGYKATHNWYYSFTTQFKTQLLNNYPKDSESRIASFLTPADLNLGIGMTYSKQNARKTWQFNASIAPLSYNLKTAIDPKVDHTLFNIPQTAKTSSEIGSNAELTFNWKIGSMVTYKTRLFLFTDYSYGMGDWENTVNIQFSRFFSTQIYANLRYDSSVDKSVAPKWNRWMLKEILSVGLSYTFSTKQ